MGIHPEFKPREVSEAVQVIRDALGHMFPVNSVRIVSDDEIAIEDNAGEDWQIIVREPG
jgi:hypothetical protein